MMMIEINRENGERRQINKRFEEKRIRMMAEHLGITEKQVKDQLKDVGYVQGSFFI